MMVMKTCPNTGQPCHEDCALFEQFVTVGLDKKGKCKMDLVTPTCKKYGPVGPGVKPK